jgi:hypothetical protein
MDGTLSYIPVVWIPATSMDGGSAGRGYGILAANPCRNDDPGKNSDPVN